MRQTFSCVLVSCTLLVGAVGCGDDGNNGGPDMSMPDLQPPSDMSLNGVVCGSMSCPVGQECCVTVSGTATTTSTCVAVGGACNGARLACDGAEDCAASQFCCAQISFTGGVDPDAGAPMFNGGNSSCKATCDFNTNYPATPTNVTTRLCHVDDDCAGLTVFNQATKCCSSAQAPGLHFCAIGVGPITCP